jgi:2-methylcitrate dehydratase PrpD
MSIKAYPCGGRGHTAIEAALALRERLAGRLAEINNIHCSLTRASAQRVGVEYPRTVEAAKFSAAYVIAYALVHGAPRIPAFTDEALKDEGVRAVARTVTASADPELGEGIGEGAAKLKVTLKDGQILEMRRDYATGSKQVPMTKAQLEDKFLDCAAQALRPEAARKILVTLNTLPTRPSFDDFWSLIRAG